MMVSGDLYVTDLSIYMQYACITVTCCATRSHVYKCKMLDGGAKKCRIKDEGLQQKHA